MSTGNGAFKIEKGIPISPIRFRETTYPFGEMAQGDSFALKKAEEAALRAAIAAYRKQNRGSQFTVRKQPDGDFRCWRIQ